MLKIPKGLKKKKKGKKSKRKGEEELFTEEELEKYKREHQLQQSTGQSVPEGKENEEWSKFKDLTTGVDSILKKTQGDLDRIKSTSFFQRIPTGPKEVDSSGKELPKKDDKWIGFDEKKAETQASEYFHPVEPEPEDTADKSEYGLTDEESEEEEADDIFDTSYVEAVERGEVQLAYVPDSPEDVDDDGIFDTSYAEKVIKGQDAKLTRGKKTIDIGVAVEVLTGRIDNLTNTTTKRPKRVIPGDLLLESVAYTSVTPAAPVVTEVTKELSLLDTDADVPITTPIDLSVSLHTALIQQQEVSKTTDVFNTEIFDPLNLLKSDEEDDEFTKLAAESLENTGAVEALSVVTNINVAPVLDDSWSTFEKNKESTDQLSGLVDDDIDFEDAGPDPFDTSFAAQILPISSTEIESSVLGIDDDDDFNPRADEIPAINNRRKSSVHIHLTDPFGVRESISGDDVKQEPQLQRDLLGRSTTDLTQLNETPLDPVDVADTKLDFTDPFDTTVVDKIVAPGKVELKLLEREFIGEVTLVRSPSDPDFDPRADERKEAGSQSTQRKASRPENLIVNKTVLFDINNVESSTLEAASKPFKPSTPYYTRDVSVNDEDIDPAEAEEARDSFTFALSNHLPQSQSDQDIAGSVADTYLTKRRHSDYPGGNQITVAGKRDDIKLDLNAGQLYKNAKVLTPAEADINQKSDFIDPFDTSIASSILPSKTELKLLAKEFSNEREDFAPSLTFDGKQDLLESSADIFQVKALSPETTFNKSILTEEDFSDPFDTTFASNIQPGKTELKLLESEFLE